MPLLLEIDLPISMDGIGKKVRKNNQDQSLRDFLDLSVFLRWACEGEKLFRTYRIRELWEIAVVAGKCFYVRSQKLCILTPFCHFLMKLEDFPNKVLD